jgi:hypothetical protein
VADKYNIHTLRRAVLTNINETLSAYKMYYEAVEALIEFVPYAYANTRPVYSKIDDLRDLVVRYVISNLGDLGGHRQFKKLLHNGGYFVTDSWQLTWHGTHEWMS